MIYVCGRIGQAIFLMAVMSIVVFIGLYAIGDPLELYLPPDASAVDRARVEQSLGLDKSIVEQYFLFVTNLLRGDMGTSYLYAQPATDLIFSRMGATIELALVAVIIAALVGIPLGLIAGYYESTVISNIIIGGSILAFSIPTFWVGISGMMLFSVGMGWLPSGGRGETAVILGIESSLFSLNGLRHLILPAFSLALFKIGLVIRLTCSGVQDASGLEFIRFARAKGISEKRIIFVHILKFVLIPVLTVIAMEFGSMIAFAVVTESIFSWPGMGKLIIESINNLDRPVVVAYLMIVSILFVTINLMVDLAYFVLDPRTRANGGLGA